MIDSQLTAAAQRVLAALEAETTSAPAAEWLAQLVRLLAASDGRAAELLRGLSLDELPQAASTSSHWMEWKQHLLRRADRHAIRLTGVAAAGTEHLLLAVFELDECVGNALAEQGLRFESILQELEAPEPDLPPPPSGWLQIRAADPSPLEEAALHRILDANANRCREGLRVVEDFVRFSLDDELLSRELKQLRHSLTQTLIQLGQVNWTPCRDAAGDVGAKSGLATERHRGDLRDVVRASCKRVAEALRALEEYSKLIDSDLSGRLSTARFRFYTVEKALEALIHSRQRLASARLYLLVTDELCRYGAERTIRETIDLGVDVVQIREKPGCGPASTDSSYLSYLEQVRRWTQPQGVLMIVNDRPDLAVACGADGVHLGQTDMPVAAARSILGGRGIIGVSTHHVDQARAAVLAGADYLGVGPVFPSRTKEFTDFAGLDYVRLIAGLTALPWFAIGGIDATNLKLVQAAGGERIAVSSVICSAAHPRGVARTLVEALSSARTP